jgi:hypothetical protein
VMTVTTVMTRKSKSSATPGGLKNHQLIKWMPPA